MDAKITNSNENKANPVNYSTQGFTGDPISEGIFVILLMALSFERAVVSVWLTKRCGAHCESVQC